MQIKNYTLQISFIRTNCVIKIATVHLSYTLYHNELFKNEKRTSIHTHSHVQKSKLMEQSFQIIHDSRMCVRGAYCLLYSLKKFQTLSIVAAFQIRKGQNNE